MLGFCGPDFILLADFIVDATTHRSGKLQQVRWALATLNRASNGLSM